MCLCNGHGRDARSEVWRKPANAANCQQQQQHESGITVRAMYLQTRPPCTAGGSLYSSHAMVLPMCQVLLLVVNVMMGRQYTLSLEGPCNHVCLHGIEKDALDTCFNKRALIPPLLRTDPKICACSDWRWATHSPEPLLCCGACCLRYTDCTRTCRVLWGGVRSGGT